jgi:UTP-glucose-1-phosphate uridylyltransferase
MAIIIPCAGKSSRFPGTRPKFLLTMFDGKLMIEHAISPYIDTDQIHIIILSEHEEKYDARIALESIYNDNKNVHIHTLKQQTNGPAETVYSIAKKLDKDENLFIKDCDSFFDCKITRNNYICVADLRNNLDVSNVAAKSFACVNNQNIITNVIEKSVVSNYICVGGYNFDQAHDFCTAFEELTECNDDNEIFVSHVIKNLIQKNIAFAASVVDNYIDVGTYDEFISYNHSKPTIFCDLDGTVFINQSEYFSNSYKNTPVLIKSAVDYLLKKQKNGSKIIFTTSRSNKYKDVTVSALEKAGFVDVHILFDLPHAPRVVINDNSKTNPYPSAVAINVPRDDDRFWNNLS